MADVQGIEKESFKGSVKEELLPTQKRIMGNISYLAAFLGGCVSIGTFSMGASLIGVLNFLQAVVAMGIGCTVIAVALTLCGKPGHKYGIPYPIQARSVFGVRGAKIPGILRAVPAIIWFGFQSWVGAGALNSCLKTLFGISNWPVVFVFFTVLQIILAIRGFRGIKWLENIGCIFIILTLGYMFYTVLTKFNSEVFSTVVNIKGTWGLPFWGGTTAFLGIYATMIINSSDYAREYRKESGSLLTGSIYWIAILPVTLFMGLIGLMVSGASGSADPVAVFSSTLDNKALTLITLLFIAFAQITTNVLNNILPPVYVLMDIVKCSYKKAVIFVGVLSMASFPWQLVKPESAEGLSLFVKIYSAFLGPIFAVMVFDYYFLRKQELSLKDFYESEGVFKGYNWAGIIAIFVGAAISLCFLQISWYVSLVPSVLVYYLLMRKMKAIKSFTKGTILATVSN